MLFEMLVSLDGKFRHALHDMKEILARLAV
jgi:hypothetical protein